jgi:uncharacterized linocin/CFP29 family protein
VNLGLVGSSKAAPVKGVEWGQREVQPLIEFRVPFQLDIWDLDNVSRGSKTADLDPVVQAAQKAALFEEQLIYKGFKNGGIEGLIPASQAKAITLPKNAASFEDAVESAVHAIQIAGIGGPFQLVLGRMPYQKLAVGDQKGYPLRKRVMDLLDGGSILWSPAVDTGVIVSSRGGDAELTIGQDFSIGYHSQEGGKINLYITESLTFRVLEPAAAVELKKARS